MTEQNKILHQIAVSMANFAAPMLLDEKYWAEAERMAEAGLLLRNEPVFKSFGYSLTPVGIEAYNLAFPLAPPSLPVKAWGSNPPRTLKECITFIQAQCTRELEDAYWLEVEDENGDSVDPMTLSETALNKKLEELGYDRYANDQRIRFGREEHYALYTCNSTGALIDGTSGGEPENISYELDGFAWRRSNRFQMEERDWQEARAFIFRLDNDQREQETLIKLIVDSCFLEPEAVNDTGMLNPGGGCQSEYSELVKLFDFLHQEVNESASTADNHAPR